VNAGGDNHRRAFSTWLDLASDSRPARFASARVLSNPLSAGSAEGGFGVWKRVASSRRNPV
jgi:hypothetical protein